MKRHLYRTAVAYLMGTMLGIACGLAFVAAATDDIPPALTSVVVKP